MVLLLVAGQAGGQSIKKDAKPLTLFTIKGALVSTDEFIYLYKKNHLKQVDFTPAKVNEYLDLLVNFKLKVTEAKARGMDTTTAFRKEFKMYKEELKKPYLAQKDELDRLTQEAYQRLREEVRASHILITMKADATPSDTLAAYVKLDLTRERILGGEDFEKIAREVSEDPSAKGNGGDLGYFTVLQMVYPVEQAAYQLKVGEISQPIRTRFGYHLVKVTGRRPAHGEVEVSHIMLRTGTGDEKKIKNKIFEIDEQLRGGRNWDELCKEYSEDPATKNSGGRLRPFGVGTLAGVPEFEGVAFSLREPGEISDPFKSAYGWHIVRLEKKIPTPPYAEVENSLKRKISRDERLQLADRKKREEEKKQYGYSENEEVMKWFTTAADSSLLRGKWKFTGEVSFRSKTCFTLQGKPIAAGVVINFIEKNQALSSLSPAAYMSQLLDQFVGEKMDEIEDVKLMAENPEYRNLLREYEEGILLFTIMEKEVWTKAPEDTAGLKKFYAENREKYQAGERVRAKIFSATDKMFLDEIEKKVADGDSLKPDDLKKFKSIQPSRNYQKGDNKAIDKTPWAIGIHRVEVDETHYLVEVENLLPRGIKGFEEARAQVVSDYQDKVEKQWLDQLRIKYPVKINNKGKKFVLTELTKGEGK